MEDSTPAEPSFKEQISRTPMSQQWNLSLQQQFGGGFLIEVAYSANHGTHLLSGSYDLNQADPAKVREFGLAGRLTNNVPNPFAGRVSGAFGGATITQAQALRPYPYFGNITVFYILNFCQVRLLISAASAHHESGIATGAWR
jgi:hypothetical protein